MINFGSIVGTAGAGVTLAAGGLVVNGSITDPTASIGGRRGVSIAGSAGTVLNYGQISTVYLAAGGTVVNGASGTTGTSMLNRVELVDGGMLENYGTIVGAVDDGGDLQATLARSTILACWGK